MKAVHVTETYMPDLNKYQQYVKKLFQSKWISNNGVLVQELQKRLENYQVKSAEFRRHPVMR